MRKGALRWLAPGLACWVAVGPVPTGLAGAADRPGWAPAGSEDAAQAPGARTPRDPAGPVTPGAARFVGIIIAVVPESRTLVIDVPFGWDILVGAVVTPNTKIEAEGRAASFDTLRPGARVRIHVRQIPTGTEAISVEVLRGPGG